MSKFIVIPSSKEQILNLLDFCDGFILGLTNFSVNLPITFSLEEIKDIIKLCKSLQKQIFISLNKNMHNTDIDELKSNLVELSKLDLDGLIFYDIAIVNLNKKLNLNLKLFWHQEHLVTNYYTINYWCKNGVYGSFLSSELTKKEILDIKDNTNCPLMMNVFGFIPMFTSKRPLVKNYLAKFNLQDNSKINYLEKENNIYPITSTNVVTVYSNNILNLAQEINELSEKNIAYFVFNSFNIESSLFKSIMLLFYKLTNENQKEIFDKINMLLNYKSDTGFLYKNTVYKVKKNG